MLEWERLTEHMTRARLQVERIAELTEAPKFLFESGPDDKSAALRVHAAADKLIGEGKFQLPARQVLIEDPIQGGTGRQFYLCTQRSDDIEVWGASKLGGHFALFRAPKIIPLRTGTKWTEDVNSPTIAVKEFVLALNAPTAVKIDKGDYTHVGWIKGQMPTTKPGDFEDFIEALRRGEVLILDLHSRTRTAFVEGDPNRWSLPVYDFGPLLNGQGDGALDSDLLRGLLEEAPKVTLPAESCVFMFRDNRDPIRGSYTRLVRVDGLRQGKPDVTFTCAHVQRHVRHADMTLHPGYWSVLDPGEEIAEGEVLAETACRLLTAWHENFEVRQTRNYRTAKINKKRMAANLAPIQPTLTIHITEQRVVYLHEQLAGRPSLPTGRVMPQHTRRITDRWVFPKNPSARPFRPYQRKPQEIVVNRGRPPAAGQFRVVQ
jgi:hypothetical protein